MVQFSLQVYPVYEVSQEIPDCWQVKIKINQSHKQQNCDQKNNSE
jgi:hypothetical protein